MVDEFLDSVAAEQGRKRTLAMRYTAYTLITALSILAFHLIERLLASPLSRFGTARIIVHILSILLLGGLFVLLARLASTVLNRTIYRRRVELENFIPELRDRIEQCSDISELGDLLLKTLQDMFDLEEAQLTLYFDQPLALEVTHLRRQGSELTQVVERVREDAPPEDASVTDALTPLTASQTEVLTHRDRLVGLLLLGAPQNSRPLSAREMEQLRFLVPIYASSIDQMMMIRHLSETNQRLFESEKLVSIGQLASGLAHEIRNPLSSIKMNLQGLKRTSGLGGRDVRRVAISLEEIERLDNIVTELMQFARRTTLNVSPIDAATLIEESLAMVRSELKQRGVRTRVEIADDLPEIRADENRLIRILINLVINAAQAMGEKEGTITVRAEPFGSGLEIQVSDEGPGIPEELRREIFNPFFTTKAEGTGLGLANALKFVQEHGGELDFITESGQGTTFSVRLPAAPPPHLDDPSALRVVPT